MRFSTTLHFKSEQRRGHSSFEIVLQRKQDPHCHFPTINSSGSNDCQVHIHVAAMAKKPLILQTWQLTILSIWNAG